MIGSGSGVKTKLHQIVELSGFQKLILILNMSVSLLNLYIGSHFHRKVWFLAGFLSSGSINVNQF